MLRLVPYWSNARWHSMPLDKKGLSLPFLTVMSAARAARFMSLSDLARYRDKRDTYTFIDWCILRYSRVDFWVSSRVIKAWDMYPEAREVFDELVSQGGLHRMRNGHRSDYSPYSNLDGYSNVLSARMEDIRIHAAEQDIYLSYVDEVNLALVSLIAQSDLHELSELDNIALVHLVGLDLGTTIRRVLAGCPIDLVRKSIENDLDTSLITALRDGDY